MSKNIEEQLKEVGAKIEEAVKASIDPTQVQFLDAAFEEYRYAMQKVLNCLSDERAAVDATNCIIMMARDMTKKKEAEEFRAAEEARKKAERAVVKTGQAPTQEKAPEAPKPQETPKEEHKERPKSSVGPQATPGKPKAPEPTECPECHGVPVKKESKNKPGMHYFVCPDCEWRFINWDSKKGEFYLKPKDGGY